MFKTALDVLLRLLENPWFVGLAIPVAQPFASLALRRIARRSRLDRGDWALGPEFFVTAMTVWLAAMAVLQVIGFSREQQASLEVAWFALLCIGWLAIAVALAVRRWGLESDGKTPVPLAVAIPAGLAMVCVSGSYLVASTVAGI